MHNLITLEKEIFNLKTINDPKIIKVVEQTDKLCKTEKDLLAMLMYLDSLLIKEEVKDELDK